MTPEERGRRAVRDAAAGYDPSCTVFTARRPFEFGYGASVQWAMMEEAKIVGLRIGFRATGFVLSLRAPAPVVPAAPTLAPARAPTNEWREWQRKFGTTTEPTHVPPALASRWSSEAERVARPRPVPAWARAAAATPPGGSRLIGSLSQT